MTDDQNQDATPEVPATEEQNPASPETSTETEESTKKAGDGDKEWDELRA